jgi:hypothetical protein
MRSVGVGEAGRPEDVQAEADLDVHHGPQLAGLDAAEHLLRRPVEEVVVVLDQRQARLLRAARELLQLGESGGGRLLEDDVRPGLEGVHGQAEVGAGRGGDVHHRRTDLGQHRPVIGEPAGNAVPLRSALRHRGREVADPCHLHPGDALQTGQVLAGDLPRADENRLHIVLPSRIRPNSPSIAVAAPSHE